MGKKKEEEPKPEAEKSNDKDEDEEEDTPCVKALKAIDDRYCSIEAELEKEIQALRKKYEDKLNPLTEERRVVLHSDAEADEADKEFGTPGCPGFWSETLSNVSDVEDCMFECDNEPLKYLHDIRKSDVDPANPQKGTRIEFEFKPNPFFTNDVLWYETHTDYDAETHKGWKEVETIEIKSCTIDWKPGKNITVEKKAKESGKKGSRKKPPKAKEEPCPSFFRILFEPLKEGDEMPKNLECVYEDDDEDDDDEDPTSCHLENMGALTEMLTEQVLPFAVRYYTGEASGVTDDDFDEDEEEEEEDDDEDSDDSGSDDEPPARGRGGKKKPETKKPKANSGDAEDGKKTEECKQQ